MRAGISSVVWNMRRKNKRKDELFQVEIGGPYGELRNWTRQIGQMNFPEIDFWFSILCNAKLSAKNLRNRAQIVICWIIIFNLGKMAQCRVLCLEFLNTHYAVLCLKDLYPSR